MNIRRGLVRIWIVLTALLLIPLGIPVFQDWEDANGLKEVEIPACSAASQETQRCEERRFKVSKGAFEELLPWEQYHVLSRIAELNGIKTIPSQGSLDLSDIVNIRERILEMAKVRTRADRFHRS